MKPSHTDKIHWETVTPYLKTVLLQLMQEPMFDDFRLVGGTALSLQCGHRLSIDIDLFTDKLYGTIDFDAIDAYLRSRFAYVWPYVLMRPVANGTSYSIGTDAMNAIKLDIFYTDEFIQPQLITENIRLASIEEILAMKMDVVLRGGRKKDFWDIHAFINSYSAMQMQELHTLRYPYTPNENLLARLTDFTIADQEPDPVCLKDKNWPIIKLDITEWVEQTMQ